MKRRRLASMLLGVMLLCSLMGCVQKGDVKESGKSEVDYSEYEFADVIWTREGDGDVETLCFSSDGGYRYYCSCGNPVEDSDLVESYSYNDANKTFTLHCIEVLDGMTTEIVLIACDGDTLELDFGEETRIFVKERSQSQGKGQKFNVDLRKVNLAIEELADPEVVQAARNVVDAFLLYEDKVAIEVKGNTQRFVTDMMYIVHCTCPMFGVFADFNEMTAYDADTGMVSWKYRVTEDVFETKVLEFTKITEDYLGVVRLEDSEAMRAILLYHELTKDLEYDYSLIGDEYNLLSKEEAALRESPYNVLVNHRGICTNNAQALVFLYTQAGLDAGTVFHTGGQGVHMWNFVLIDGKYYYCDPTFDIDSSFDYFGITAADKADWAGGYSADAGTMLGTVIPYAYEITDTRFEILRTKMPVELSDIEVDRENQTITFYGYEYEYTFDCKK